MKQTAVQWLVEQMIERKFFAKNTPLSYTTLEHLANEAKEMEKEQLRMAYNEDRPYLLGYETGEFFKEYYKETYEAQEN